MEVEFFKMSNEVNWYLNSKVSPEKPHNAHRKEAIASPSLTLRIKNKKIFTNLSQDTGDQVKGTSF